MARTRFSVMRETLEPLKGGAAEAVATAVVTAANDACALFVAAIGQSIRRRSVHVHRWGIHGSRYVISLYIVFQQVNTQETSTMYRPV